MNIATNVNTYFYTNSSTDMNRNIQEFGVLSIFLLAFKRLFEHSTKNLCFLTLNKLPNTTLTKLPVTHIHPNILKTEKGRR